MTTSQAYALRERLQKGQRTSLYRAERVADGRVVVLKVLDPKHTHPRDVDRLRKDMDAPEVADQIIANFNLARSLNITSTPTFIVGTHMLMEPSAQIDFAKTVAAARAK